MFQTPRWTSIIGHDPMAKRDDPAQSYRQAIPAIQLSLERATPNVPQDGHYHVLLKGQVKGRFRSFKQAQVAYKTLIEQSGYTPPSNSPSEYSGRPQAVERYMDQLEDYWLSSHKHRRRGGKTMYRS